MSRWKASAIHCGVSFLLVSIIAALMASTWYPPLLAWAGGKTGLIGILLGVDVCIGPLLTLLVFKSGKPGLKFDLSMIALLQLLALGYGLYSMFEARPVYIVFSVDRFDLVSAVDIPQQGLEKAKQEQYKSLPLTGPKIVAVRPPQDSTENLNLSISALRGGPDLPQLPQYYLAYQDATQEVLKKALPLAKLMGRDGPTRDKLAAWLDKEKRTTTDVKYLPLIGKAHELTVLIDGGTAKILDILAIDPT